MNSDIASVAPELDAEWDAVLREFHASDNPTLGNWLPGYRKSTKDIAEALANNRAADLVDTLWKDADNFIAHAGLGLARYEEIDGLRSELIQVIQDIHEDGSPANFERVVERFEQWKEGRRISRVPRVLIARAFAGIHPHLYHTTVDARRHDKALRWFAQHSGFAIPRSTRWAERAHALGEHLDKINVFHGDIFERNVFPWFVVTKLGTSATSQDIPPGHKPRPDSAFAHLPESVRIIALRHNSLQAILFEMLALTYGKDRVWTECPTGTGGRADAIARPRDGGCYLYEIKIGDSAVDVVRQAMGQLLEYSFRAGGLEPTKLFVVGEPELDDATRDFLERLRDDFNLDIDYLQVRGNTLT